MRHLSRKLLMAGMIAAFILMFAVPVLALSQNTVEFKTTAETASAGCKLVAADGVYVVDAQAALNRINEIRLEACKEGIDNPSNEGTPLTEADYVPIKWSSSLEYIARVRAAEASIYMGHTRPNGDTCWTVKAPDGEQSWGEVLAWNSSASMIPGINQWYGEKADWVNKTEGAVTGHYTQMIDPENLYVGIGCFLNKGGIWFNTTSGEFSSQPGSGSTPMSAVPDCRVIIEVRQDALQGAEVVKTSAKYQKEGALDIGDTISCELGITTEFDGRKATVMDAGSIKWTSSNTSVATVSKYGTVLIKGVGTAVIKAASDSGKTASITLNPAHTPKTVKGYAATCTKTGLTDGEKCSVCGKILKAQKTIAAKGHTPATMKGHAATCTKDGLTSGQKCSVCGVILKAQSTIRKTGHKIVKDPAVEPTFASAGLTEGTHCAVCKTVLTKQKKVKKLTDVPSSVKAKARKKKVTVSWKKVTDQKLLKQIQSIQVQYATNKKFKKAKTKTFNKTESKITLKLRKKKTYYIRVRFKGVKGNSKWSTVKKVKTKK